jgi:hypothetical protein
MPCPPQYWRRYIWAYQPTPTSSEPSCGVFSPQSPQNRWNRSDWTPDRISLRQARYDVVHQSSSAAIMRCQRRPRPPRCVARARPTRWIMLQSVKGRAERAIIASSYETPISPRQPCQPDMCWAPARSGLWCQIEQLPGGDGSLFVCSGSRAAVVASLMVLPVCPQLRKCLVRPGSYAWCDKRSLGYLQ